MPPTPRTPFGTLIRTLQTFFGFGGAVTRLFRYGTDAAAGDSSVGSGFSPVGFTASTTSEIRILFSAANVVLATLGAVRLDVILYDAAGIPTMHATVDLPAQTYFRGEWYDLPATVGSIPADIPPGSYLEVNIGKQAAGAVLLDYVVEIR